MLDSVPTVETCSSSSSSGSSSLESIRPSPPLILDLFIFVELEDILEMPEVEAAEQMVPVETKAHTVSPVDEFSHFCMFHLFCADFVDLDIDYAGAHEGDGAAFGKWFRGNR
jgi:hypothetical protein